MVITIVFSWALIFPMPHLHHLVGNDSRLWILPSHGSWAKVVFVEPFNILHHLPETMGFLLEVYHDLQIFGMGV